MNVNAALIVFQYDCRADYWADCDCDYALDGYKLQWSNCTKELGVHMDIDLKFTINISKIVHTVHSRAAVILKCFHTGNPEVLVKAFCT